MQNVYDIIICNSRENSVLAQNVLTEAKSTFETFDCDFLGWSFKATACIMVAGLIVLRSQVTNVVQGVNCFINEFTNILCK